MAVLTRAYLPEYEYLYGDGTKTISPTTPERRALVKPKPEKRKKRSAYIPGYSKPYTDEEIMESW